MAAGATFDVRRDLSGIVASLHTPFTADDRLDELGLARLVDHVARAGCTGVLASAVAGEVGSLRPDERQRLLEVVGDACRGRLRVVAGVSAAEPETSLALARSAAALGADMVLWQPPAGLAGPALQDALARLGEVAPVMLQDLDWHGGGLALRTIVDLAEAVPGFEALKIETAPAGPKYTAVRDALGDRLHLSGGWAAMQMLDGLARGLDAFIPSGVLTAYCRIWRLWAAGERAEAQALFERCLPILAFSNQDIGVSIAFWKRVRLAAGIFATDRCRPPVQPLDAVQAAIADQLVQRIPALDAAGDGGD
jgi:4-hydroxy-tetrahydrodipicolinate synthase